MLLLRVLCLLILFSEMQRLFENPTATVRARSFAMQEQGFIFAPGSFAEKRFLKLVKPLSGYKEPKLPKTPGLFVDCNILPFALKYVTSRLCIKMRARHGDGDTRKCVHGVGTREREMRDLRMSSIKTRGREIQDAGTRLIYCKSRR